MSGPHGKHPPSDLPSWTLVTFRLHHARVCTTAAAQGTPPDSPLPHPRRAAIAPGKALRRASASSRVSTIRLSHLHARSTRASATPTASLYTPCRLLPSCFTWARSLTHSPRQALYQKNPTSLPCQSTTIPPNMSRWSRPRAPPTCSNHGPRWP
jgi:hypothetical protein